MFQFQLRSSFLFRLGANDFAVSIAFLLVALASSSSGRSSWAVDNVIVHLLILAWVVVEWVRGLISCIGLIESILISVTGIS